MNAGICGLGSALPAQVTTNEDLMATLETSDEWIVRRTGIQERRWLSGSETIADLTTTACLQALADAGRSAADVDYVIVSTITADRITPGVAPEVAFRIGAHSAAAYDVGAACAGFIYALDQAAALIESGRAQLVLVCGADAMSRIVDKSDRTTTVIFGDGVGAVLVASGDYQFGLQPFELCSDGSLGDLLYVDNDERLIRMQGQEIYRNAVRCMAEATRTALTRAGMTLDDVDLFVSHQANARIIESTARELGLPDERVAMAISHTANTSSASVPLALAYCEREGLLHAGDRIVLAAFGAGLVWGAGVLTWKEEARVAA
ncbi:MAG: beta-ketoacyl-ACP synthase III [Actinomycetota bacterium]